MPRLAVIGDADLDESVALALDAIDDDPIPPAIDPLRRRLLLAELIERHTPAGQPALMRAAALQPADGLARVSDPQIGRPSCRGRGCQYVSVAAVAVP